MGKEKRGFASMDPAKQRAIASKGGKASRRGKAKSRHDGERGERSEYRKAEVQVGALGRDENDE